MCAVLIGFLSGVGLVQITLAGDVRENKIELKAVKEDVDRSRKQFDDRMATISKQFDDRMANIIRLWEAQLNTERELIALVREQIRVIERKNL